MKIIIFLKNKEIIYVQFYSLPKRYVLDQILLNIAELSNTVS